MRLHVDLPIMASGHNGIHREVIQTVLSAPSAKEERLNLIAKMSPLSWKNFLVDFGPSASVKVLFTRMCCVLVEIVQYFTGGRKYRKIWQKPKSNWIAYVLRKFNGNRQSHSVRSRTMLLQNGCSNKCSNL
ncbi:hypothetical protein POM88_003474 [Heracleum sosnowskyi]|uniref:Uncharacterized protein n=1 Tax=Heracleum sosnowskyi TaxID=360622 RepID=A0AAD8JGL5_9APIA|nr:hypothetical protein POM88_003474 [Heracleum sosnowskyi]